MERVQSEQLEGVQILTKIQTIQANFEKESISNKKKSWVCVWGGMLSGK